MNCKSCKNKLDKLEIYCSKCGTPTETFKSLFKLKDILSSAYTTTKSSKNYSASICIFIFLFSILPIIVITFLSNLNLTLTYWQNYLLSNLIYIAFIPISLVFLTLNHNDSETKYSFKNYLKNFSFYPRFLFLIFLSSTYFFILKIICQGDPILNLVRLVLVLWGLAIALPIPLLIVNNNESVIKLAYKAYLAGKYTRWQQFSLVIILSIINFIAIIPLGFGLIYSLPFTANTLKELNQRHNNFNLYDKNKDY